MSRTGPEFYDVEGVFDFYVKHRSQPNAPNETIEQPILWELIGDPQGLTILDLGCGDARVSKRFQSLKAAKYTGIEGSSRMFRLASEGLDPAFSEVRFLRLEDFQPEPGSYDLIVSSLALHYVDDLGGLFEKVRSSLKPSGRFVFSVEHPVITSCNDSLETSPVRGAWIVDRYFDRGAREVRWMGDVVTKYHRTVQDYFDILADSGLKIDQFRESDPPREYFADEDLLRRRQRIPLFMIIAASSNQSNKDRF